MEENPIAVNRRALNGRDVELQCIQEEGLGEHHEGLLDLQLGLGGGEGHGGRGSAATALNELSKIMHNNLKLAMKNFSTE